MVHFIKYQDNPKGEGTALLRHINKYKFPNPNPNPFMAVREQGHNIIICLWKSICK